VYRVKPVLKGHLWDKEKVIIQDRWPLKSGYSYEIFHDMTRKMWPFNTGDCLIEVTAWAGFTVLLCTSKKNQNVQIN